MCLLACVVPFLFLLLFKRYVGFCDFAPLVACCATRSRFFTGMFCGLYGRSFFWVGGGFAKIVPTLGCPARFTSWRFVLSWHEILPVISRPPAPAPLVDSSIVPPPTVCAYSISATLWATPRRSTRASASSLDAAA